jgi:hypothetical protein
MYINRNENQKAIEEIAKKKLGTSVDAVAKRIKAR